MAISVNGARFIAHTLKQGVLLGDLVTLGHLGLYAPKSYLNHLLASAGRTQRFRLADGDPGYPAPGEWSDELYTHFGAKSIRVMDGSDYEGADLVHNLNQPLPPALAGQFDCLIDGGTLEHVFNVPEAIASYMKLVKVGGHVMLLDMPATNACGHGFYQFSPAFFWQVFAQVYGFEVVEMLAVEAVEFAPFWRVGNPAGLKRRVELMHDKPCHLYVLARKVADFQGFATMPIQEDYAQSWTGQVQPAGRPGAKSKFKLLFRRVFSRFAPNAYWKISNRRNYVRSLGEITLGGSSPRSPYVRIND